MIAHFAPPKDYEEDDNAIKIAIVGRPNVGKSSLVNAFLGEQRVIVSDIPGTTRDAIDTPFRYDNTDYILIDTAGIRRKSRIKEATEKYSVIRALKSIERADVVLVMLDATAGVSEQDQRIAGYVHEAGKANIIVVNKWDLVEKDGHTMNKFDKDIREDLKFLAYAPIMYVSALTKKRIFKVLELVDFVVEQHHRRINTSELNRVVNEAMMLNPLPGGGGKRLKSITLLRFVRPRQPLFFLPTSPKMCISLICVIWRMSCGRTLALKVRLSTLWFGRRRGKNKRIAGVKIRRGRPMCLPCRALNQGICPF